MKEINIWLNPIERGLLIRGLEKITKFTEEEFHSIDELRDKLT